MSAAVDPTPRAPVRIEHAEPEAADVLYVDWTFGNGCNYACSYCPASLHDGSVPWTDLPTLERFCERLLTHYRALGRRVFFNFTGGEPTLCPHFLELLTFIRARGGESSLISNASRGVAWWMRARELLDAANLTHHIEFSELEHFVEVTRVVSARIRTHVNVTMKPDRFDEGLERARKIAESCSDITLTLKPLFEDFRDRLVGYSPEQLELIRSASFPIRRTRPLTSVRGMMRVIHDDGHVELTKPSRLIAIGANRWLGWYCHIGLELLAIKMNGDVYRGVCREGGRLGRITDPELELPVEPIRCGKVACTCATDIMTTRTRSC